MTGDEDDLDPAEETLGFPRVGEGALAQMMTAAMAELGIKSRKPLRVMSKQTDPFVLDTERWHTDGQWFTEHFLSLVGEFGEVHLRGFHYRLISTTAIIKPNGIRYLNTDADWNWLQDHASKAARWLGYIPFERIIDERNDKPYFQFIDDREPEVTLSAPHQVPSWALRLPHIENLLPSVRSMMPRWELRGFMPRQKYRIAMIGEKTSLKAVLDPLARRYRCDLLLPTGDISDTMLAELVKRAVRDGRTLIVLYFSDFDPRGYSMATGVARRLQAHVRLNPGFTFKFYPVALTKQQCIDHQLPETPLKRYKPSPRTGKIHKSEKENQMWREAMGREQTEIDALAVLRPEILSRIAEDFILHFYDATLGERAKDIAAEWEEAVNRELVESDEYQTLRELLQTTFDNLGGEVEPVLKALHEQLAPVERVFREITEAASGVVEELHEALSFDMPDPPDLPEADIHEDALPEPLIAVDDPDDVDAWIEATRKLQARKAYEDPDEGEDTGNV